MSAEPDSDDLRRTLGEAAELRARGDLTFAEAAYRKARDIAATGHEQAAATLELADVLEERGDARAAQVELEVELSRAPPLQRTRIQVRLARMHLARGELDAAGKLASTALNGAPPEADTPVILDIARLFVDLGRPAEARSALEHFIPRVRADQRGFVQIELARLYADGGEVTVAEEILRQVVESGSLAARPVAALAWARSLQARGDRARAIEVLEGVTAGPGGPRPDAVVQLSRLYEEVGDREPARSLLEKAADSSRGVRRAVFLAELGDLYVADDLLSEAERVYREALELSPAELGALDGLAVLLEHLGDRDEALMLRRRADDLRAAGSVSKPGSAPAPAPVAEDPFDLLASAAGDLPASKDLLGFEPLVRALYALLDDPKTALPLAIAVTAPWGAGKSSVMRQLKDLLDAAPGGSGAVAGDPPRRDWRTVRFDAWKYERSERLWAALVKAIYDQAQGRMSLREKVAFRIGLERRRLGLARLLAVTLVPLLAAVTVVTAALSADVSKEGTTLAGLTATAAILATASRYGSMIVNPFRRAIEKYAKRPDFDAQLGFTAQADSEIRKLVSLLAPGGHDGLAVFVDDLDRCSSAHVVEVVEAMNQIFNAAEDHRCVFVLGLDRDIVATNISVAYGPTVAQLKADGNPLGDHFGSEFLAKLVQLSVAIPPPDASGIHRLMEAIVGRAPVEQAVPEADVERAQREIRERAPDEGVASVEEAAAEVGGRIPLPAVEVAKRRERAERIKDSPAVVAAEFAALGFLAPNPRLIKRFHNAFRLQLYVASEDDRVTFDFSSDQLVALARWVALRLRWPSLADAIAREPTLLAALEDAANDVSTVEAADAVPTRYARWVDDPDVIALIREEQASRRLSALRLDAFVRVA